MGIGGCIVLTGTDLSAGRAVGITACISASLLQNAANMANKMWPQIGTLPIPVVIVLAMLIGAAIGCFNGFFVAKFKLHPFIVTLGTQLILYTVLLLYVQQGNNKGMAISNLDPSYTGFVKGSLFSIGGTPIPNYVLFAIVLTAVMWFVWNKTTFGKNMFALGSNEEAAQSFRRQCVRRDGGRFRPGRRYVWFYRLHRGRTYRLQHGQHRPEL